MSTVIKLHDKRSGKTYFYELVSYWDRRNSSPGPEGNLLESLIP